VPAEMLMPRVAPAMQDGMVVKWLKNEGDPVKKGEIVVEITSEKASCEVEAQADGILHKILANPGDVIPVNKPLAIIRLASDTPQELAKFDVAKTNPAIVVEGQTIEIIIPTAPALAGKTKASPLARRIAAAEGTDLAFIGSGSGPDSRIIKKDVLAFLAAGGSAKGVRASAAPSLPDKRIPLTAMRQETANRLRLSKDNTIPVTSVTEIDLTALLDLYKSAKSVWKEVHDVNVTLNAFFIKAVAICLRKHELLNSTLVSDEIIIRGSVNVGLAMNHNDQLFVPVIRNADALSVREIAAGIAAYVEKVKENKLTIADMSDGTFTVTNVGPFDVQFSTPVIAYPQVGILGIGKVNERPVFAGDDIIKRYLCYFSLTYDHRVIDGVPAAAFRKTLKHLIEQPLSLLG
jgi:pyruvate dehydrogenase E2 component (dihydrolipoamide acetyltransferase)